MLFSELAGATRGRDGYCAVYADISDENASGLDILRIIYDLAEDPAGTVVEVGTDDDGNIDVETFRDLLGFGGSDIGRVRLRYRCRDGAQYDWELDRVQDTSAHGRESITLVAGEAIAVTG